MKTRSTNAEHLFSAENLRACERYVFSIQQRLDKAVATNNVKRIRHIFDLLTKRSFAVKVLAVYRITRYNKGKNTAGVDGIAIPKGDKSLALKTSMRLLNAIDVNSKPNKIRRVYIPKSNGKKRPLGIPTLRDRINQEITRIALEPIVEYHSHDHSFGFRPKRSCQDAIALLFIKLAKRGSPRYVVEGDIKGCFDNISHEHIAETLKTWLVPSQVRTLINKMLKARIFHNGEVYANETGTPQGGVISPLLANVALTALDNFIETNHSWINKTGQTPINPIVRYADDFVIIAKSKSSAVKIKQSVKDFLTTIGLTLSDEKTRITHIHKGFDFLGFSIKKYKRYKNKPCVNPADYVLLIKPQKEKILNVIRECNRVMNENKTVTQNSLIHLLNPKILGWANYYRYVVNASIFSEIDKIIWASLLKWGKRRHSQKSVSWTLRRYFIRRPNTRSLVFYDRENKNTLRQMVNTLSKTRFVKVKNKMRVYYVDHAEYWRKREYANARKQIYVRKMRVLFEEQNGECPYCNTQITDRDIRNGETQTHHMLPRTYGGTESYSNLRLLHSICHNGLHKRLPREKMAQIVKTERLDYINAKHY